MAPRRNTPGKAEAPGSAALQPGLLSIILPTYNEADNLPIVIWLLARELGKRCAVDEFHRAMSLSTDSP
jgi:hypothetical protein